MTPHDWIVAAIGAGAWVVADKVVDRWVSPLLARLRRPRHPCADGHDWRSYGGRNASCCRDCHCSVPVHECARCGDCDYGDNAEAAATIAACETAADVRACTCQFGYDMVGGVGHRAMDCPVHGEEEPEGDRADCGNCYGNGCASCGGKGWVETATGRERREAWEDGAYDRARDDRITGGRND